MKLSEVGEELLYRSIKQKYRPAFNLKTERYK